MKLKSTRALHAENLELRLLFAADSLEFVELPVIVKAPLEASFTAENVPSSTSCVKDCIAGDANQDGSFNERDIVMVLQGGKYLTGEPATWNEGDWNHDGAFDHLDLVLGLQQEYKGGIPHVIQSSEASQDAGSEVAATLDASRDGTLDERDIQKMLETGKYLSGESPVWVEGDWNGDGVFAGDANQDGSFNERDIVMVLQGGKYLTGEPATWNEGDWNHGGLCDQLDVVLGLQQEYKGGDRYIW